MRITFKGLGKSDLMFRCVRQCSRVSAHLQSSLKVPNKYLIIACKVWHSLPSRSFRHVCLAIILSLSNFSVAANATIEGKVSKPLKKLLKKLVIDKTQEEFAVADAKLAINIKVYFNLFISWLCTAFTLMKCLYLRSLCM